MTNGGALTLSPSSLILWREASTWNAWGDVDGTSSAQ